MTDTFIEQARQRFAEAIEADTDNRTRALDDLKNLTGEGQWPEEVRSEREDDNRPCLTINRLPQFVRQVTGDIRRMNPAINVLPDDDIASQQDAEIIEGLIRQIQYRSKASRIYEKAAESAAQCGFGYFRVRADWTDEASFEQEIKIEGIDNPFSVYFDPAAKSETREDADYAFVTEMMDADDFDEAYPKASKVDVEHDGNTDALANWHESGKVIVAEYIYREYDEVKLGLMRDGTVIENPVAPLDVVRTRTAQRPRMMWAKITGKEVLEGPERLPGVDMPIVAVLGEELNVGEEVYRSSVIRHAKDPQRLYNYWRSAQTEMVALQPKAPYILSTKQIQGHEAFWQRANDTNEPYLTYTPDKDAPPPQRATPPVPSAGMMQEVMTAGEDMKATTGIFDAGLGNSSNEKSGIAIRQRQMESDVSTSIYSDNMAAAIEQCGRVIIGMIPEVYDTARTVTVLAKDDVPHRVPINGVQRSIEGVVPVNDVRSGKYNVKVSVGPNYSTRRQETAESMIEFVRAFPAAGAVTADLVAKTQDWPGADEFAERLKKILPPGVAESDEPPTPEEAMMMQRQQQMAQAREDMALAREEAETAQEVAGAHEARADAEKARLEVAQQSLELAMRDGTLNAAIAQMVEQQVARALQSVLVQQAPPLANGPY